MTIVGPMILERDYDLTPCAREECGHLFDHEREGIEAVSDWYCDACVTEAEEFKGQCDCDEGEACWVHSILHQLETDKLATERDLRKIAQRQPDRDAV